MHLKGLKGVFMEKYMDASLDAKERAKLLLQELDLEEKVLQVSGFMPMMGNMDEDSTLVKKSEYSSDNISVEDIKKCCPNGIGHISTLAMREMASIEEAANYQKKAQKTIMELSKHHIPAMFHMEGVCGAFLNGAMSFPCNIARGASWNAETEEEIGKIVSRQEKCAGITQVLAPVLDVTKDPRLGRYAESYSEDATLVSKLGAGYTKGIQEEYLLGRKSEAVAKHFVGSHVVEGGIHGTNVDIPERQLYEIYSKPFQAAINEANLKGVMPCYCGWNGEPMSSCKQVLTKMLKEEFKFDGLVVSDYSAISNIHNVQHVYETVGQAGAASLEAGMDVELPNREAFNDEMMEIISNSEVLQKRLDEAVLKVLEAKFAMGLFEYPYAFEKEEIDEYFLHENDNEVALKSATEGIVLLKNNNVLPIDKKVKKIALIGPHADNPRAFFGDYTHLSMASAVLAVANSIAGIGDAATKGNTKAKYVPGTEIQSDETKEFLEILYKQKPEIKSLLEQLRSELDGVEIKYAYGYPIAGNDMSGYDEALKTIEECDVAILTLGGRYCSCSIATMGEGVDATNINLPEVQDEFIVQASKLNKPLIGVHMSTKPISSDIADKYLDGILEAWTLSEKAPEAIVGILTGKYNPSGKLPVTVTYNVGQIPLTYHHYYGSAWHQGESIGFSNYVDMPHTPRYPFGYGLSYTDFEYKNLQLSKEENKIKASFELTNTGKVKGTEIVQVYFRDLYSSVMRPVQELCGFGRVTLEANETKKVDVEMDSSALAFLDKDMKWKIEKGEYVLQIGASSQDIRLEEGFNIKEDSFVKTYERKMYAEVESKTA